MVIGNLGREIQFIYMIYLTPITGMNMIYRYTMTYDTTIDDTVLHT